MSIEDERVMRYVVPAAFDEARDAEKRADDRTRDVVCTMRGEFKRLRSSTCLLTPAIAIYACLSVCVCVCVCTCQCCTFIDVAAAGTLFGECRIEGYRSKARRVNVNERLLDL